MKSWFMQKDEEGGKRVSVSFNSRDCKRRDENKKPREMRPILLLSMTDKNCYSFITGISERNRTELKKTKRHEKTKEMYAF